MPKGDGTGPDGKGPKSQNKGWPEKKRDSSGAGKNKPQKGGCCRKDKN